MSGFPFLLLALLAAAITAFAARRNYFTLPPITPSYQIRFRQTAGAFLLYVVVTFLYVPLIWWMGKSSWHNLIFLLLLFCALGVYLFIIRREAFYAVFWGGHDATWHRFWKGCGMGVVTWFIAYPYVLLVNGLVKWWIPPEEGEQVAVKFLKGTMGHPVLLIAALVCVVLIVPFLEETLFRGFLQSWLRKFFGRGGTIIVTALIFSAVHYAPNQNNIEILTSLFVLSLFLGFIYERERSLFAPIALHTTFNLVSAIVILVK
ncbi:MAG: CPBP family intramembrane metalloprotease [Chlamydiales bacterium]|nr:CPBP family intramembrane metalloprotease [Chlamydiales bacterium]